ncbi:hypothetical protein [Streptomyces afghaniensis]|uniref:hypothetical protein n=1 Tax=Streptomyces afghaniensis TaxID=66865 RepID=UPI002789F139|nr:hypothetical protein [Streptomyces afghaniensis]MDQ1016711.1 hypothetical protein [Streptomyces afghaniensis]
MSADNLLPLVARVKPGDYVTAFGKDTRGHEVTRTGTLLDEPKEMKATHNGAKVKAVRVCVGEKGTDPATRQTWTTLIPGHGSIRKTEPPKPGEWMHAEIRNIPAVRSARDTVKARLLFGGKGGKRSTEPQHDGTLVDLTHAGAGRYEFTDVKSGEAVFTGSLQSQVWWAYPPEQDEHQDQEPEADPYSADLDQGRALGLDYDEAHDYAESRAKSRAATAGTSEPGEIEWKAVPAREMHHRGVFLYGGKGNKGTTPQRPVKVHVVRQGFSSAELEAVDSGEVVATPRNAAKIWAAKVPEGWQPGDDDQAVTELGKPVVHVETGALVGFWTPERFTPVEEVPGYGAE